MSRHKLLLGLGGWLLLSWACGGLPAVLLSRRGQPDATPRVVTAAAAMPSVEARPGAADSPLPTAAPLTSPVPPARPTPLPPASRPTPYAGLHQPPAGIGLLPRLEDWQPWTKPGSWVAGRNEVRWVEVDPHGRVADFQRRESFNDGGGAGLHLPLDLPVQDYAHAYITVMGRILDEQGGNIAGANPQAFPESGLQVHVRYQTAAGEAREWFHGFYITPVPGADVNHFTLVAPGEWFTWTSDDLMQLPEPPVRVTQVWVYGFGWAFHSQVAAVELTASDEISAEAETPMPAGSCWLVSEGADTPVYDYPAEGAPLFGTLPQGSRVEVLAFGPEGWVGFDPGVAQACAVGPFRLRWAPITQANWVEGACEGIPEVTVPRPDRCYVTPAGPEAQVYAEPRDDARVIAALPAEAYVPVVGQGPDGWLQVLFGPEDVAVPAWMRLDDVCLLGYGACDALPSAEP